MKIGELLNQVVQLSGPTIGTGTAAVGILSIQGSYGGLVLAEVGAVTSVAATGGTVLVIIGAAGLVGLMIANSSGEIEKPQIKQDYSNWQDKGIKPSKEKGGKPKGEYEIEANEGTKRQNKSAKFLADEGYDIEMLKDVDGGNGNGLNPKSNPDWLIEGKVFDCYAPLKETKGNSIVKEIAKKTKEQTKNIVLNLDGFSNNQVDDILNTIRRKANLNGDLKRLEEILVLKDNKMIWKWTW